ncbi:MAG: cytochrome c biogenesis protein CcsA [Methylococcales bacterium]|nr:cytochrome c biogenesis protein CcsA [Methylococcales bacterium]
MFTLSASAALLSYGFSCCLLGLVWFYQQPYRKGALITAWLAVGWHLLSIVALTLEIGELDFSLFSVASLISWLAAALVMVAALDKPVENLGLVIFPLAMTGIALRLVMPVSSHPLSEAGWAMQLHVLISIAAFSLLTMAAGQSLLVAIQDRHLRRHQPSRLIMKLPPLQAMEALLFQIIAGGWLLLALALGTGFVFLEDMFAQHLAHKTVLTLVAWLVFSGLLVGRWRYGWRGPVAIRGTLLGFGLLLLGYLGSKLVLELILNRR